ncbi:double-strand break repair helicase AddA [Celeribacter sp.]|uniref:double-strand break repair helicase AddA n=1 Tax=Celeribacter sp. TaxID=1890673 RepID=UPI003A8F682F
MTDASARQITAAHPERSTWLSANAGSGKTKVLTDRVARLLLRQTPPQNILCLTYTKAAAAEMQNRLLKNLGRWAMLPDDALKEELRALDPEANLTPETLSAARRLFASAVETPGGLKIQTIHSFCSGLLRRFPLEAGVSPQFQELDNRIKQRLLEDILDEMARGPDADLIDGIVPQLGAETIFGYIENLLSNAEDFETKPAESDVYSWHGLPQGVSESSLVGQVFLGGEKEMLEKMAALFATSDKSTDVKFAEALAQISTTPASIDGILALASRFLVQSKDSPNFRLSRFGLPRGVGTKGFIAEHSDALTPLEDLMKRVEYAFPVALSFKDAERTLAVHRFAHRVITQFKRLKRELGYLDFDDMIRSTRDLLSRSEMAQWVLYRLDGGLDHILVDEAQDTSPTQWEVIRHLAEEFAAGTGARDDVVRTIFVVGDKKQSIYSFQGADPTGFDRMRDFFDERLRPTGSELQQLTLEHSFRSAPEILTAVDHVFEQANGRGVGGETRHIAFFGERAGRVDLWPIVSSEPETDADSHWSDAVDKVSPKHHRAVLSELITEQISDMLENGSIQGENGQFRAIEPRDIMILVRSRTGIFSHILSRLKSAGLPVAGADRLIVSDELGVRDLISLLSFLALEDDDLSLAEALRSPIFNLSEQELFTLAHGRGTNTLWSRLRENRDAFPQVMEILDDLRSKLDFSRPYELLDRILTRHGARRRFLSRLGAEAEDGIDQLLNLARTYESADIPSLTGFLAWFEAQESTVKRQLGDGANLIRVMTTHGAKGLEAPIVILPECAKADRSKVHKKPALPIANGAVIANGPAAMAGDVLSEAIAKAKNAEEEEDRRLLYVAMTRAERWLIVAGSRSEKDNAAKDAVTWHDLVSAGLETLPTKQISNDFGIITRYQTGDWREREEEAPDVSTSTRATLPSWIEDPAPRHPDKPPFLSPSDLGGAKALFDEPVDTDDETAMRRGRQIHVLLDTLQDVPRAEQRDFALLTLGDGEDAILESEVDALLEEVRAVFDKSYDWAVFGSNSISEVPFSGELEIGGEMRGVHGIIDRLIVEDGRIQIVDFKTNAVIPKEASAVPVGLLRQLGAYAQAAERMYPNHTIEVALLWTRTAELMPIPLDIVRKALRDTSIS